MEIKLDLRSGVPIYLQIMDQIKHLIATGALRSGDQLPTVRQLASDLRVNFNTIARSYRLLDEAGIISTQQGRGTYILSPPSAEAVEQIRQQALHGLTRNYLAQVQRLGTTPGEIREVMEQFLGHWEREGVPPDSEPEDL